MTRLSRRWSQTNRQTTMDEWAEAKAILKLVVVVTQPLTLKVQRFCLSLTPEHKLRANLLSFQKVLFFGFTKDEGTMIMGDRKPVHWKSDGCVNQEVLILTKNRNKSLFYG